ncbi:MAG: TSUP family transporter [Clostridia bacterium]|nr:TSUP family transporter [Clostridia bacterium]
MAGLIKNKNSKSIIVRIIAGAFTGLINGLFGGGGGMLIVPVLEELLGYERKSSHATAILIILPLSIVSGILYAVFGSCDFNIILPVTFGVVAGGVVGALLLKKISRKTVGLIFASVMLFVGLRTLVF